MRESENTEPNDKLQPYFISGIDLIWVDLRSIIEYQELDKMTLKEAFIEWVNYKNKEINTEYLEQCKLYLMQCQIVAFGGGDSPKQVQEPNYWVFDTELYRKSILNG
jgi:hypothetical protein